MILNAEQSMVQEMMRNYAQNQLKPTAAHRDKTHEFPAQELKDLGALGAMGMTVPDEWAVPEWIMYLWCLQLRKLPQAMVLFRQS